MHESSYHEAVTHILHSRRALLLLRQHTNKKERNVQERSSGLIMDTLSELYTLSTQWSDFTIHIALLHQLEHPQAQYSRHSGRQDRIPPHALRCLDGSSSIHLGLCSFRDLRPGMPVLGSAVRGMLATFAIVQERLL